MSGSHIEVESKYNASPSFRLPPLDRVLGVSRVVPPEVVSLHATYFDTADLRLACQGVTLRRRTGGADEGWHLKLPLAEGGRREVHRPLGRSRRTEPAPPIALLRLARSYSRAGEVAPVARLLTERTQYQLLGADDVVLAEVADDQVTGQALGGGLTVTTWREIEVELALGDRALLAAVGRRLLAAGAQPATASSKLVRTLGGLAPAAVDLPAGSAGAALLDYLREQVAGLLAADVAVRLDQPDSTHSMRVATRRMRSVLATYRPLLDRTATEPIRAELQWLGGVLGDARDAEVIREGLLRALGDLPGELVLGPVRTRLDRELRTAMRLARQRMLAELDGDRYLRLLEALNGMVTAPALAAAADRPAAAVLPERVAREWRRLRGFHRQAAEAPTPTARDQTLHELRKAAKRARYAAELAVPVLGDPAGGFAKNMKRLQTALGTHQDTVVARHVLRAAGARAYLAGENGFTFGLLHGLEQQRADRAERQFLDAWAQAARKRHRRWLR